MVVPVKTDIAQDGDVFIREGLDRAYDADSVVVANAGASPVFYPPGTPMVGAVAATAAVVTANATVDGLVLVGAYVPPGGGKLAILRRFAGIVVNETALPTTDIAAGAALVLADMRLNMTRLGIVYRAEPPRTTTHAT